MIHSSDYPIEKIQAYPIKVRLADVFFEAREIIDTRSCIVVGVTVGGVQGIGTVSNGQAGQVAQAVSVLASIVSGCSVLQSQKIWQLMTGQITAAPATTGDKLLLNPLKKFSNAVIATAIAGIDLAVLDARAKIVGLPVWKLLGAARSSVDAYATGGYYHMSHTPSTLADEMRGYVDMGFKAVKMKLGGLALEEDEARVAAARAAIGPDIRLMIDANGGYSLHEAIEAIRRFEQYDPFWFEEPLHWNEPVRALGRLARSTPIPIASGESEIHSGACMDLITQGGVSFMQFDAARAGGATEWLRLASAAAAAGVRMSTHHNPHIHAHLAVSVPNGFSVEVHPDPVRNPFYTDLFKKQAALVDGVVHLDDTPGFGFEIDWDFVESHKAA